MQTRFTTLEEAATALVSGQRALGQRMTHDSAMFLLRSVYTGAEKAGAPQPLEMVATAVDLLNGLNLHQLAAHPLALAPMLGGGQSLTGLEPMLGGERRP